jgi:tRNA1(Val) A37 N6-methylase TrmN6
MAELSADRLLDGRVLLAQPLAGYRVAIDPILLAAATPIHAAQRLLDAGCGSGAAMLCILARAPACRAVGLEAQADLAEIARRNLAANGLTDRATIVVGDVAGLPACAGEQPFDVVIANPPFLPERAGTPSPRTQRRAAHVESLTLASWVDACLRALRPGGWCVVIQRADRLAELCAALAPGCGDVAIFPLWPKADSAAARRVIVRARKGGRGPTRLARGLVLHEADGRYTAAAEAILRHGAALEWPG